MTTLAELLNEIRQLLGTLSDRFAELSEKISGLEQASSEADEVATAYIRREEPEYVDDMDETQSLEPPPPDGLIEDMDDDTKVVDADEPKTGEMEAVSEDEPVGESAAAEADDTGFIPPPGKSDALSLLEKLARLQEIVEKKGLEVSPKDLAFLPKSTQVYASLSQKERTGPKGARIVLDCINFLDTIIYKYAGDYYSPLREAVEALTRSLSEFLQREVGYRVVPLGEKSRRELEGIVPDYTSMVQERPAYSAEPAGTIIAVRRRGAVLASNVVRKAQVLVSSGEESDVSGVLEAGLSAVSSLKAGSDRAAELKLKAVSSMIEWREKLHGSSEDHALTVARYALNLLHTLETSAGGKGEDLFEGQIQKLKKINDRIASLLRSGGFSEIVVSVGGSFDESYDPSKYERRKTASDRPDGTIVGVLRRGFLDRNGIPIQKAVVAVSGK